MENLKSDHVQYVKDVADEAYIIGLRLAKRAHKNQIILTLTRVLMTLIGILAIVAAYVPSISNFVGSVGVNLISGIAAITLIVSAVISMIIDKNPPVLLVDYSRYILGYRSRIFEILSEPEQSKPVIEAKLGELLRLANKNLEDVKSRWPWVIQIKNGKNVASQS